MNTYELNKEDNYLNTVAPLKKGHYCDIYVKTNNKEFLDFIDKKLDEAIKEFKETHQ